MDETDPDPADLLCRLLATVPARYVDILIRRLDQVYNDTGHGEVVIVIYRGKIASINGTVKEK